MGMLSGSSGIHLLASLRDSGINSSDAADQLIVRLLALERELDNDYVFFLAMCELAPTFERGSGPVGWAQYIFAQWTIQSANSYAEVYKLGHRHGRSLIRGSFAKRAAGGRKAIGRRTAHRVVAAVEPFRHLSREAAAAAIAGSVGLSVERIKKILTDEFPGMAWKKRRITDTA